LVGGLGRHGRAACVASTRRWMSRWRLRHQRRMRSSRSVSHRAKSAASPADVRVYGSIVLDESADTVHRARVRARQRRIAHVSRLQILIDPLPQNLTVHGAEPVALFVTIGESSLLNQSPVIGGVSPSSKSVARPRGDGWRSRQHSFCRSEPF